MRQSAISLESETTEPERALLVAILRDARLSGPHLEIGTAAGGTLKELMKIYPDGDRPAFVVVDPLTYFPNQRETVERNLRQSGLDPSLVDFRVRTSWEASREAIAKGERFSFIFIDAVHKAKEVTEDLAWTELLEPGGIVAFHDYKPKFPGVMWALDHFLRAHPNYERLGAAGSLVVVRKRARSPRDTIRHADIRRAAFADPLLRVRRSIRKRLGHAAV